jgi:hypothetical protein
MTVHVLYENPDWLPPLVRALEVRGLPHRTWFLEGGEIDLAAVPPEGVYVNRMSPSAHTRGHQGGVAFLREYLPVLEHHGRRVINGSAAFALEVSKVRQDITLRAAGILTPHTVAVIGTAGLLEAARKLGTPFLTKHNQGGKGLGVKLFRELGAFEAFLASGELPEPPDGVTLLQRYIQPPEPFITRVEIVGGQFQYALRSSTAEGFELCPADTCAVEEGAFCPVGPAKFTLRPEITERDPLVQKYLAYCEQHGLDVAGIEFVEDAQGNRYTYDVNANSNYNQAVEVEHGLDGMGAIAELCARALGISAGRAVA